MGDVLTRIKTRFNFCEKRTVVQIEFVLHLCIGHQMEVLFLRVFFVKFIQNFISIRTIYNISQIEVDGLCNMTLWIEIAARRVVTRKSDTIRLCVHSADYEKYSCQKTYKFLHKALIVSLLFFVYCYFQLDISQLFHNT